MWTTKGKKMQFEKQIIEPGVQPMEFVSMDLVGEFHPPSSKRNRYALNVICMLTGYTFCIPIKNKSAEESVIAWRNHITFPFGVCRKLLMDNGTEFKNDLFSRVFKELGVERKIYSSPYRPQSNGYIDGFHKFLKRRSASMNEVQVGEYTTRPFNAVEYIRNYDTLSWIKS